jgi:tyrosyl-tRNA synthetase
MKTADADVGKYLEMFTFLKKDQVTAIMNEHQVMFKHLTL